MGGIITATNGLSLLIWVYLLLFHGQFWRTDQQLTDLEPASETVAQALPSVVVVVPARNEADVLPVSLRSLLSQDYESSQFHVVLVDDQSEDGTAHVARQIAQDLECSDRLTILSAQPLPPGWTGKLWALQQGVTHAIEQFAPDYLLLTDADIEHAPNNLRQLVQKAKTDDRELVSLMVRLRTKSAWEQFLIPAFVFFFAKLYPFRWVNHPTRTLGAAAGGCILVQRSAIARIGGIAAIRDALIDDCTLGQRIKSSGNRRIWLGLTTQTHSLRPYDTLETIWSMVARTAYTQLNYSPWLLVGTLFGMTIVYLAPILGIATALFQSNGALLGLSFVVYSLMSIAYWPIVRFYRCGWGWSLTLPAIAFLYTLMTLDSARRHWQGRGGQWKGRTY